MAGRCGAGAEKQGEGHQRSWVLAQLLSSAFSEPLYVLFRWVWASSVMVASGHSDSNKAGCWHKRENPNKSKPSSPAFYDLVLKVTQHLYHHIVTLHPVSRGRSTDPICRHQSPVLSRGHGTEAVVLTVLENTISRNKSFWAFCLIECCS